MTAISPDGRWAAYRYGSALQTEYTLHVIDNVSGESAVVPELLSGDVSETIKVTAGEPTVVVSDARLGAALVSPEPITPIPCEERERCQRLDGGPGPYADCLLDVLDGITCSDVRATSRVLSFVHRARKRLAAKRMHGAQKVLHRALHRVRRLDRRHGFGCCTAFEAILQSPLDALGVGHRTK